MGNPKGRSPLSESVSFSRSVYRVEAVRNAIAAYEGLATFTVAEESDDVHVTIAEPDPDVADVIKDEFSNHVLFGTVVAIRNEAAESDDHIA